MKSELQLKLFLPIFIISICVTILSSCDDEDEPKTIPEVVTTDISDIAASTAIGGGEITDDGNAEITIVGLVYSNVVLSPTLGESKTEGTPNGDFFSSDLSGLSSGTTYYVRAYATNSVGTGYGEVKQFTTSNLAPLATNVLITGTVEVNKVATASYSYSDPEGNPEGGTSFQWYVADNASGTGETVVNGATNSTFLVQQAQFDKFLRVGIIPKASSGSLTGTEVKSSFVKVGEATTVTFTYNGSSVTYGILTSAATNRKWLDRNLGAAATPSSATDFANYGDLLQWGRPADEHQLLTRTGPADANATAVNGTVTTLSDIDAPNHNKFIVVTAAPNNWRSPSNETLWQGVNGINNPCPEGWRIATRTEWEAENLGTLTEAYNKLKITFTGRRSAIDGSIASSADNGSYWSSTVSTSQRSRVIQVSPSAAVIAVSDYRSEGKACRCIMD